MKDLMKMKMKKRIKQKEKYSMQSNLMLNNINNKKKQKLS